MSNPSYVKVDGQEYKINTDFRIALECNTIAQDESIGEYERALAIIYKLFGEEGLDCKNQNKLLELALKYLSMGEKQKPVKTKSRDKYELDYSKCKGLIQSSFKYDYGYDPYEMKYLHWYNFSNDLQNLSTSEFGNCCILNRVAMVLNSDLSKIKNATERNKQAEVKEELRKKYCVEVKPTMTKEQEESAKAFYKSLGINL